MPDEKIQAPYEKLDVGSKLLRETGPVVKAIPGTLSAAVEATAGWTGAAQQSFASLKNCTERTLLYLGDGISGHGTWISDFAVRMKQSDTMG